MANIMGFQTSLVLPPPPPGYFMLWATLFLLAIHLVYISACPVCYLPVEEAIALMPKFPSPSPVLKNLKFVYEENLSRDGEFGGSDFGGYPTLKQRNGNFDEINEPSNISEYSRKTVCFLMFVDEITEEYLRSSGKMGISKKVGLWRVIVAHNIPYTDARRTGKIPKLLLHRMAPNACYSIWLDGKLELVVDPYQILERYSALLYATEVFVEKECNFAISKHYKRFDVFMEAEANKVAGKYDNASIDFQVDFYKNEGLTPYTEAKLPLISDVPEGCVIVREHIPISNLFTCLWHNEVDQFTSRDQISFAVVRDKLLSRVNFHITMFLDCERRNFVVQKYHRDLLLKLAAPISVALSPPPSPPPPLPVLETLPEKAVIPSIRRGSGRHRRPGSRGHRKVVAGNRH
ncbi:hypothetical protein TanjilG_29362 [Lupinus angustifolius]|uniref:TOD1/MUCI70 glycosyltransferase-like domain-containing protein n=1 Tax=Lupinus angustifolius TaxID=3871 RepID=A0A394DCQ1_LUPAN|nr:hypothetical protein TanjilG_29362 [Lupinus angustifolius]